LGDLMNLFNAHLRLGESAVMLDFANRLLTSYRSNDHILSRSVP
jgi:hypothetical protein